MKTAFLTLTDSNGRYTEIVENVRGIDFYTAFVVVYREDDTLVAFPTTRIVDVCTNRVNA